MGEVDTFYAVFDDVLRFDCESPADDQPAGSWDFARGVGLVRYEAVSGELLELVAPY